MLIFFTIHTLLMAEHLTVNQVVAGSSPAGGVEKTLIYQGFFSFKGTF